MSQVLGVPELKKELQRLANDIEDAEDPAAMAAGEPIRVDWQGNVPIDEGHYREALVVVWLKERRSAAVGTGWVSSLPRDKQPFVYSKVLEFGNDDQAAQPSARPAMKSARKRALDAAQPPFKARIKGRRPRRKV